jgi:hypothetical protein
MNAIFMDHRSSKNGSACMAREPELAQRDDDGDLRWGGPVAHAIDATTQHLRALRAIRRAVMMTIE